MNGDCSRGRRRLHCQRRSQPPPHSPSSPEIAFMKSQVNRRRFLQGTAVGAAYFFTATALSAARAADSPNSKVRFAGIGAAGKGGGDISQAGGFGDVVALCDVDERSLARKAQEFPSAKKYFDYRKMLDE